MTNCFEKAPQQPWGFSFLSPQIKLSPPWRGCPWCCSSRTCFTLITWFFSCFSVSGRKCWSYCLWNSGRARTIYNKNPAEQPPWIPGCTSELSHLSVPCFVFSIIITVPAALSLSYPLAHMIKNPPAGDPGLIPGWERSPGAGNGNPFQYFCLENPMDREAWQAAQFIGLQRVKRVFFFWLPKADLGQLWIPVLPFVKPVTL